MRENELELADDRLTNHAAIEKFGEAVKNGVLVVSGNLANVLDFKAVCRRRWRSRTSSLASEAESRSARVRIARRDSLRNFG